MMQEQLMKMAAAALGITPEATQKVVEEVMVFVQTANARIGAIELQTADIHRMMLDLHKIEFPEKYLALEDKSNGGLATSSDTGGSTIDG